MKSGSGYFLRNGAPVDATIFYTRGMGWDFTVSVTDIGPTHETYSQVYTSWHTGYSSLEAAKRVVLRWARQNGYEDPNGRGN